MWLKIFYQMLRVDFIIFKQEVKNKIINACIFTIAFTVIAAYLLPAFGTAKSFGLIMAAGLVACIGSFELFSFIINFMRDISENKIINFYIALPIPTWFVFMRMVIYSTYTAMMLGLCIIITASIILWNPILLYALLKPSFYLMLTLSAFFYGTIALIVVTLIKHMGQIGNVWMRAIFPLYVFGGFQFTWYSLYMVAPRAAYLDLLNPFLYTVEGMRAAILGPQGNLPLLACLSVLLVVNFLLFITALKRLKRNLDYV
jgi:ABC-type polysaccharide/polyol phosphate export permease